MYYGLVNFKELNLIVDDVINTLDKDEKVKKRAKKLLLGTIAQETHCGTYRDPSPYKYGSGLCQFDKIAFDDIKNRIRQKFKDIILQKYGIDLDAVEYRELELSPLLSVIMCRLKYKLIPEAIPESIEEQAKYYKKYYNTMQGKATIDEYITNYTKYVINNPDLEV